MQVWNEQTLRKRPHVYLQPPRGSSNGFAAILARTNDALRKPLDVEPGDSGSFGGRLLAAALPSRYHPHLISERLQVSDDIPGADGGSP
jgi:hypothetical protein